MKPKTQELEKHAHRPTVGYIVAPNDILAGYRCTCICGYNSDKLHDTREEATEEFYQHIEGRKL